MMGTEGVIYTISDDEKYVFVTGYEGTSTTVNIADSYNNLPVTHISLYAFYACETVESIVIPDTVTHIGSSAFRECTSLTSVTMGNGVTSIGSSAFRDCTSLESVTITEKVTELGVYVFYGCDSLANITVSELNATYHGFSSARR